MLYLLSKPIDNTIHIKVVSGDDTVVLSGKINADRVVNIDASGPFDRYDHQSIIETFIDGCNAAMLVLLPDDANKHGHIERKAFAEVYKRAYGWTLDVDGYLAGLVAGDMGYDSTDLRFDKLLIDAQVCDNMLAANKVESVFSDLIDACTVAVFGLSKEDTK